MLKPFMLVVFIFLWCYPVLSQELSTSVYERISPAIVRIETEEKSGKGFIIGSDGTICTSLDIIDGATWVKIMTENGEVYDNVSMLAKDRRRGIAIIRVPGFGLVTVTLGDSDNLAKRQIFMIDHSFERNGVNISSHAVQVLGVNHSEQGHKVLSITEPIRNEVLGGPFVDTEGRVIAIAVFQENGNLAIPINDVHGLLAYAERNQPIIQWGNGYGTKDPWERFFSYWQHILMAIYNNYPWLITFMVVGFVFYHLISLLYSWRVRRAEDHPWLAPISVSGNLFDGFSGRDAAIEINKHMFKLGEITAHKQADIKEINIASLSQGDLPGEVIRRLAEVQVNVKLRQLQNPDFKLLDVAEIGLFKIPIREIVILAKMLFGWIPMHSRDRYKNALIHVSLISIAQEAYLWVQRGDQYLSSSMRIYSEQSDAESDQTMESGKTGYLTLLHDAVFMILELTKGEDLLGSNWLSKKHVANGLEYLEQSLRACQPELMTKAVDNFFLAAEADSKGYLALYIKGHILNARRKEELNTLAEVILKRALNTEDEHLKTLVHAELANCYAQQYFRLARRKTEVIEKAKQEIHNAYDCWKQTKEEQSFPWILGADALIHLLQARSKDQKSNESIKLYLDAVELYYNASNIEENNCTYLNALGFILLSLTEQGYTELDLGIPTDDLNIPQLSEKFFRKSLEVDPSNKLVHANLCLLYATDWYMNENHEKYLELSRNHGLKAVELDPEYVHGFRDFAKSLLRYKEIEEALPNFKKAMNLAHDKEKKEEIKCEIKKVLDEMEISNDQRQSFLLSDDS